MTLFFHPVRAWGRFTGFVPQELSGTVASKIRMIFRGRPLKDEDTPASLELQNETMIHVVIPQVCTLHSRDGRLQTTLQ